MRLYNVAATTAASNDASDSIEIDIDGENANENENQDGDEVHESQLVSPELDMDALPEERHELHAVRIDK